MSLRNNRWELVDVIDAYEQLEHELYCEVIFRIWKTVSRELLCA